MGTTPTTADLCPRCGEVVHDFDPHGYESDTGQRLHLPGYCEGNPHVVHSGMTPTVLVVRNADAITLGAITLTDPTFGIIGTQCKLCGDTTSHATLDAALEWFGSHSAYRWDVTR